MFLNYTDVQNFLDGRGLFHMDLSLVRMQRALQALHLTRPPYTVVQIVGTNGKGSTATFLEALARAHNVRTGLFTSPHFLSLTERVVCNGHSLPKKYWPSLAQKVYTAEPSLTYFEFLTVLALLAFAEENVELAIMEAGLGGKFDATSAIERDLLCLTPISLDHIGVLGATEKAIAQDKTAAISAHMTVIHAPQSPVVTAVMQKTVLERQAVLISAQHTALPQHASLGLFGIHQKTNAQTALCAWNILATRMKKHSYESNVCHALNKAFIPGRLQHIHADKATLPPYCILDGAHNSHGLDCLAMTLKQAIIQPTIIIFSCLADKTLYDMLIRVKNIGESCVTACPIIIPTISNNERAAKGKDLAEQLRAVYQGHILPVENLSEALTLAKDMTKNCPQQTTRPVLICGSLYLLAEFFMQYPEYIHY